MIWIIGKESEKISLKRNGYQKKGYRIFPGVCSENHDCFRPGALFHAPVPGSLTVEAALVLPIFLFFMVMILFFFRMLQIQYIVENSLDKAVAEVSLMSEISETKAENLTKAAFYKELKAEKCPVSGIEMGIGGFSWKGTEVDKAYIWGKITYRVRFPLRFFGRKSIQLQDVCRMHRWTGSQKNMAGQETQRWVYVTPTEQVYHTSRECTHLRLSVKAVPSETLKSGGNVYGACGHCARGKKLKGVIYITSEGDCYHLDIRCSGLKRTIYMVLKEKVGDKRPCSRCGGK